jgi:hypothetical protein
VFVHTGSGCQLGFDSGPTVLVRSRGAESRPDERAIATSPEPAGGALSSRIQRPSGDHEEFVWAPGKRPSGVLASGLLIPFATATR